MASGEAGLGQVVDHDEPARGIPPCPRRLPSLARPAVGDGAPVQPNRAVRPTAAISLDQVRAEKLSTELGLELGVGLVRHNLGFLFARQGDVPAALARVDSADEQ